MNSQHNISPHARNPGNISHSIFVCIYTSEKASFHAASKNILLLLFNTCLLGKRNNEISDLAANEASQRQQNFTLIETAHHLIANIFDDKSIPTINLKIFFIDHCYTYRSVVQSSGLTFIKP